MTVYVSQEVLRRNKEKGVWERAHDLEPAEQYGELKILYRPEPGIRSNKNPNSMLEIIEEGLKDFTDEDYLVLVGAPEVIAAASAYAAQNSGGFINLLVWNSFTLSYDCIELDLWDEEEQKSEAPWSKKITT